MKVRNRYWHAELLRRNGACAVQYKRFLKACRFEGRKRWDLRNTQHVLDAARCGLDLYWVLSIALDPDDYQQVVDLAELIFDRWRFAQEPVNVGTRRILLHTSIAMAWVELQ